jgi:hypothetical protein
MWPYWILFLVPAAAAFTSPRPAAPPLPSRGRVEAPWIVVGIGIALMIGYRFEVGGDWVHYLDFLDQVSGASLAEVLQMSDPGYQLINWIAVEMGWGVVAVNVIGGILFTVGLVRFCVSLPRPWLALAVAVPYLIIVVAMGYSRQGIALGFAMLGLQFLQRGKVAKFVVCLVLGATFHKTAVLLLPIVALANAKNRVWTIFWVGLVTVTAYALLLRDSMETLYVNYVEAEYQSQGALVRLLMNAVPAVLLLTRQRRFAFAPRELALWRWFAIISLVLFGVLFGTPASTAVDRVALYMLPLQLVVFSHVPSVLGNKHTQQAWVAAVLIYYAVVLFVWLNFGNFSEYWLPYRFYPLEAL